MRLTTAFMMALLLIGPLGGVRPALAVGVFGASETRSSSVALFPKWIDMLRRYSQEVRLLDAPCDASPYNACNLREWANFIQSLQGADWRTQLDRVNREMNDRRYILDEDNWGREDYWETPLQFFSRSGDCEDFAIAKYMTLRGLGFDIDQLRIVVLNDLNLGLGHAVLAVYVGDEILILDNQIDQVVNESTIHHYQPIYAINERNWWRYR